MIHLSLLLAISLLTNLSIVEAFRSAAAPTRTLGLTAGQGYRTSSTPAVIPAVILWQSQQDDDTNFDKESSTESVPAPAPPPSSSSPDVFSTLTTGVLYVFAAGALGGVLLNFLGYGYTVSLTDGIRIDSLSELRMEQSLQQQARTSSQGGIGEFFLKNPFTTTCIITGCVLAYESLVDSGKKK